MMTLRRDISKGAGKPRRAQPAVAATLALAICTLVACGEDHTSRRPQPLSHERQASDIPAPRQIEGLHGQRSDELRCLRHSLDVQDSPCTTSSFAALVRKRFFDATRFHRIVPGFVIQVRSDGHGHRRPRLQRARRSAARLALHGGCRRNGEERRGAAWNLGEPVLHRHRRERRPAARVCNPRRGHQRPACGREDRQARQSGDRKADARVVILRMVVTP